ncbi:RidA family protein (plasmid) [Lichenicola cladoniae]|uniref:RidA family protein n=1 Tax=Lichenicola cladoniae TaxID=1484109 RepID=A0A6M8I1R0_9PROT|nr:RidA family protein [Lichenicola cladoniae]NPD69315.1 RidA family protein [Acetobacteraceae bacterium]QKE93901.1 RidA family protein [Lichenicola cladoniae]
MTLQFDNPAAIAPPQGAYSHSVEVPPGAGLIFLSGQVPTGLDGKAPVTLAEQADLVFANIVAVLAAKSIGPDAIIKLTTFLIEPDTGRSVPQARAKHFATHRPASTIMYVKGLMNPAWKIEVEVIAMARPAAQAHNTIKDKP